MKIELDSVSKRYALEWILKKVSFVFESNKSYAITGHNGSGKSTLLKLISGIETPSAGQIRYSNKSEEVIKIDEACSKMSFVSPYQELIEEFTLNELVKFHTALIGSGTMQSFFDLVPNLPKNKVISAFSSGMKQRVKLALAFSSGSELILLDEPTTTLDSEGISWYKSLCKNMDGKSTIIVCSNQAHEYEFVSSVLDVSAYK